MTILKMLYKQKALLILFILVLFGILYAPYFLHINNILNLLMQISVYGIIAFAMTFVILNGELDLSVGAVMAFSGMLIAILSQHMNVFLAIGITLLVGAIIGLLIGLLVAFLDIHSFIVTLCAMFFVQGLALKVSDGMPINVQNETLNWMGNGFTWILPNIVWIFFLLFFLSNYILRKTRFGRNVFAVGGDKEVARLSGISVRYYKIMVFVISSSASALAGILLTGMLNAASPNVGATAALTVISSIVIGGTSLAGGEGGAKETLIGVLILGVLNNVLLLLNIHSFYQSFILGCLLVLVVGWDYYSRSEKVATI